MRLLIVGTLGGQLTIASKIAMDKGASVTHADSNDQALAVLRSGRGVTTSCCSKIVRPSFVRMMLVFISPLRYVSARFGESIAIVASRYSRSDASWLLIDTM